MSISPIADGAAARQAAGPQRPRRFSLGRFFSRRGPLLGLDIGSGMIKAVVLQRRHGRITLKQAAMSGTPAGVLTEGALTDGIAVARAIKALCNDYRVSERRVASAVSGERVFCQSDRVSTGGESVEDFIRNRAESVSGLSEESSVVDFQPVESVVEGSVFWVACAVEQVDWIREAISLAGRTPVVVEPQACALANAYSFNYQPKSEESALLINVGARNLTVALMRGWAIVYARDSVIAKDWLSGESDELPSRVLRGIDRHWDEIEARAKPYALKTIYVAGGAARAQGLFEELHHSTDLQVEELDPFHRISYSPSSVAGQIVAEHGPSLAVAAGLALRSFEDS